MDTKLKYLRWQCQRGVKELDALLCFFLEKKYLTASPHDQALFIQLLALEDTQLLASFFGHCLPQNKTMPNHPLALQQFIEEVRTAFMD